MSTVRNATIAVISASLIVLVAMVYNLVVTVEAFRQFGAASGLYVIAIPYLMPTICLALVAWWLLRKQRTIAAFLCGVVAFAWTAVLWLAQAYAL